MERTQHTNEYHPTINDLHHHFIKTKTKRELKSTSLTIKE
jgi:hypothetical protein